MNEQAREDYEWLMEYVKSCKERFFVSDWGCGMTRYRSFGIGNKGLILVNEEKKEAHMLVYPDGELAGFTADDIDMESINKTGRTYDAEQLTVSYRLVVQRYKDGVALVSWMLHPDGSYFADEGGFGRQDDEEVWAYAYIDTDCRTLVKFQVMDDDETKQHFFQIAVQKAKL